jgi:hypothetical protein
MMTGAGDTVRRELKKITTTIVIAAAYPTRIKAKGEESRESFTMTTFLGIDADFRLARQEEVSEDRRASLATMVIILVDFYE